MSTETVWIYSTAVYCKMLTDFVYILLSLQLPRPCTDLHAFLRKLCASFAENLTENIS